MLTYVVGAKACLRMDGAPLHEYIRMYTSYLQIKTDILDCNYYEQYKAPSGSTIAILLLNNFTTLIRTMHTPLKLSGLNEYACMAL